MKKDEQIKYKTFSMVKGRPLKTFWNGIPKSHPKVCFEGRAGIDCLKAKEVLVVYLTPSEIQASFGI